MTRTWRPSAKCWLDPRDHRGTFTALKDSKFYLLVDADSILNCGPWPLLTPFPTSCYHKCGLMEKPPDQSDMRLWEGLIKGLTINRRAKRLLSNVSLKSNGCLRDITSASQTLRGLVVSVSKSDVHFLVVGMISAFCPSGHQISEDHIVMVMGTTI
jgi:hypothetical protein